MKVNDIPVKYFYGSWTAEEEKVVHATIGDPDGQTSWEYLALLISLVIFGYIHRVKGLILLGDNIGSLNLALTLKGDKALGRISREIAWRRVRLGWRYRCGHLPSELNATADDLSRMSQPGGKADGLPDTVRAAQRVEVPRVAALWTPL